MTFFQIFAYMFSGIIGMALWAWGKNLQNILVKYLGGLLMILPMFSSNPIFLTIGTILITGICIRFRD